MPIPTSHRLHRRGGVYIAVLGTAMMASVLGLAALTLQMVQNRSLTAAADIRQAQLNAEAAIELGRLMIKDDPEWRTNQSSGRWFSDRVTGPAGFGTCSLDVIDPIDGDLASDPDAPVLLRGIGYRGDAEQHAELWLEPRREPLSSLRSAIAVGDRIRLEGSILRTNGLITADRTRLDGSASHVYGDVEATQIEGSTYHGTTTEIDADELPTMPDWSAVFDYYRDNGTEIDISSLPTSTPNLGRNVGIENGTIHWTGTPPGIPAADISQSDNWKHSGNYSLRVTNRDAWYSGAAQRIDHFVKPGQRYYVEAWVNVTSLLSSRTFHMSLYTKGSGDSSASFEVGPDATVLSVLGIGVPAKIEGTITAPAWSGDLEYAFIKVAGADSSNTGNFYMDDLVIREATTGRFIYRKVLSPTVNPFGGGTNSDGLYWIDCNGQRLIIERSRIHGTLLVLNPGSGSRIGAGPIHWSPPVAGYPALLVDGDFSIRSTDRILSEHENEIDYNLDGVVPSYIYPSELRGLVAVSGDLSYHNSPRVIGQVLVGNRIIEDSSGALDVGYTPDSLLNPPPGFDDGYSYEPRPGSKRRVAAD